MKANGLSDRELIVKYEAGAIDIAKLIKKSISKDNVGKKANIKSKKEK